MSSARANANQALYLAKILLSGWGKAQDAAQVPAATIDQAYLPAVRAHLRHAYGWFLLEICNADPPADGHPPGRCAELPTVPEGKATPGELREFAQLEADGWLADMLDDGAPPAAAPSSPGNLASPVTAGPGREAATQWATQLEQRFARMRDSLEEC
jgi:hypothetical protein